MSGHKTNDHQNHLDSCYHLNSFPNQSVFFSKRKPSSKLGLFT